jgi:endonuclease/exonuclease/phosphatase (EEP) superfamily protein YafD
VVLNNLHFVALHFLHPTPPSPTENPTSEDRELELISVAKSVANAKAPVIVTGDLNDVAWSSTTRLFRSISGLLDPRIGRGMFNTFHAEYWFVRWPLDHIFHSRHFQLKEIKRLSAIGSDHFPLLTRLVYTPDQKQPANNLEPDKEDLEESESLIRSEGINERDVPRPLT